MPKPSLSNFPDVYPSKYDDYTEYDAEGIGSPTIVQGKMEAVYGISSPSSSDSQDAPTSLPTTATAQPHHPQVSSPQELAAALGLDENEPDSLDPSKMEAVHESSRGV